MWDINQAIHYFQWIISLISNTLHRKPSKPLDAKQESLAIDAEDNYSTVADRLQIFSLIRALFANN